MAEITIKQQQQAIPRQTMRMTQQQLAAVRILSLGAAELRAEILKQAEENPALEIATDPQFDCDALQFLPPPRSSIRLGRPTATGEELSDSLQNLIESRPDLQETLRDHLIHQLNMLTLPPAEYALCRALINNLDSAGHHILAPITLVKADAPPDFRLAFLEKCIRIVRQFEPSGICVRNAEESLEVQAANVGSAPRLARFILHGHLDFIAPPDTERIARKLSAWLSEQEGRTLGDAPADQIVITKRDIALHKINEAVRFIQSLTPYPAGSYGFSPITHYVHADVSVMRQSGIIEREDAERGIVYDDVFSYFHIALATDSLPEVRIAKNFADAAAQSEKTMRSMQSHIAAAKSFMNTLEFRAATLVRACSMLVSVQKDFFRKGPGHLAPLTQRQFAAMLGVHESTVSRMADSKFIRCEWGLFPIRSFFSSAIFINSQKRRSTDADADAADIFSSNPPSPMPTAVSSDTIKREIASLLKAQPPGSKPLSDQKIAAALAERGYKIARRTVAKYRAQLHIGSSYMR